MKWSNGIRSRAAMTKAHGAIIAAILVVTVVGSVYYLEQKPSNDQIVVGASLALTGPLAGNGLEARWAYEHIVKEINDQGGLEVGARRFPLKLILLDDKLDPATAVSNVQRLLTVDKVDVLLSSVGSTVISAVVRVTEQQHTPWVTVGISLEEIHRQGYKYLFSPFHKNSDTFKTTFDILDMLQDRPSRIAIWAENTILGQEFLEVGTKIAIERGYTVVFGEQYTGGATDLSALILKTMRAGAEVVIGIPTTPDSVLMLRQSRQLNFFPKMFMLVRAASDPSFGEILGNHADGVMTVQTWHPDLPFSGNRELVQAYRTETGKEPTLLGSFYAAAQISFEAVRLATSTDPEAVRKVLVGNEFSTVIGNVKFREDGTAKLTVLALQWQQGGLTIVWPRELAEAEIIYPLTQE